MNKCAILFLLPVLSAWGASAPFQISMLENDILRVQASTVGSNFTQEVEVAAPTNRISGTILDLRFADGSDASGLGYFADQKTPLVILVNGQTRGAAAALAAQLRSAHKGIVIGSTNSPENTGPDIVVAVDATSEKTFQDNPFAALTPDKTNSVANSNEFLPFIDHTSEAELVRRRVKDGDDDAADAPRSDPVQPVIHDPALARAVDLLKALAALHKSRG